MVARLQLGKASQLPAEQLAQTVRRIYGWTLLTSDTNFGIRSVGMICPRRAETGDASVSASVTSWLQGSVCAFLLRND